MYVMIQPPKPTARSKVRCNSWRKEVKGDVTFNAHVREEEDRTHPGDFGLECLFRAPSRCFGLSNVFATEDFAGLLPEHQREPKEFEDGGANLEETRELAFVTHLQLGLMGRIGKRDVP